MKFNKLLLALAITLNVNLAYSQLETGLVGGDGATVVWETHSTGKAIRGTVMKDGKKIGRTKYYNNSSDGEAAAEDEAREIVEENK